MAESAVTALILEWECLYSMLSVEHDSGSLVAAAGGLDLWF